MRGLWDSPHFLLLMTMWMWAGHAVAARLSVGEMSPMAMMGLRWFACLAILAVVFRKDIPREWPKVRARLGWVVAMGGLGMGGFTFCFILAAHRTTAVNLGILQSSIPAIVMLLGLVLFGTRARPLQLLGLAASIAGVLVLTSGGSLEALLGLAFNAGDVIMLAGCVAYSGYTVALARRIEMHPAMLLGFFAVPASLLFAGGMAFEAWQGSLLMPGWKGVAIVAYCAIFPSLLAQVFFMQGVALAGPNRAGFYLNLVPVFAALMAVAILSESLHPYHATSLALVLGGIYLAEKGKERARPTA